jgi:hypothetical protein
MRNDIDNFLLDCNIMCPGNIRPTIPAFETDHYITPQVFTGKSGNPQY